MQGNFKYESDAVLQIAQFSQNILWYSKKIDGTFVGVEPYHILINCDSNKLNTAKTDTVIYEQNNLPSEKDDIGRDPIILSK